ncbi:MAG: DNA-3-methyladenine glycosylase [Ornithinimicrobium sp.]
MSSHDRGWLAGDVLDIAPRLLGRVVRHAGVAIRLSEVEAYCGPDDPGSHAFRGPTPRSQIMFGQAGHAYVYFSYGMHHCLNVVCGPPGTAAALLLRAGEVVEGEAAARSRRDRGRQRPHAFVDLARGPARLTSALGVDLQHNGADVCDPAGDLVLDGHEQLEGRSVSTGARVGVSGAGGDGSAYPWRFWITGDPTVSAYRAAKSRRAVPPSAAR